jgi:hypothetical protein
LNLALAERAFRQAPLHDLDVAVAVIVDGLLMLVEGTRAEVSALRREIQELKAAMPPGSRRDARRFQAPFRTS